MTGVGEVPAEVPPISPPGGFHLPSHLLDFRPSSAGEQIWSETLGPFKQLVEENIVLLSAVAGFFVCAAVGWWLIGFVSGRMKGGTPEALRPLPGNSEFVGSIPGDQGSLF